MRTKKLLSLILSLCLIFTAIGSVAVVNADDVAVVNVGQGVNYALPVTVNDVNVTKWVDNAGNEISTVDTSLVGYRYYTAALEDNSTVTYRINVGEYKVLMRDDFETYTETQYTEAVNQAISGGTFKKNAYAAEDKSGQQLKKDGENTVLVLGPYRNDWGAVRWVPDDYEAGDAFKISAKFKIVDFDPSNSSNTTNYFIQLRPTETNGVSFRAKTNGTEITATQVYYASTTAGSTEVNTQWENNEGKYSMKEYQELSIESNGIQYSAYLDGAELVNSQQWKESSIGKTGLKAIDVAKSEKYAVTNAATYIDELTYSKAVYVTDTLENVSVTAAIARGDSAEQTAVAKLNMSDGTTKDFTVSYTADTTTAGVFKADGKIEGFDGVIPVTYSVTGIVMNDDFQNAELGTLTPDNPLNGWTVTNTKGTVEDTVITFEKEEYSNHHITQNNVLKINRTADDTEDSKDYILRRELPEAVSSEDADVMSVKFNIMRNNNNTIKFTVGLESEYEDGVAKAPFEFMLVSSQIYLPGSDVPFNFDGKYGEYSPRVGIWHEFEIVADIKNDYVYFYEQDKLLSSGRIENAAQKIYGLSAITLESDSTGNGSFNNGGGFIWVDDVKVELFSEQEALEEAGCRLETLFRGRLSENIELPDKGWYDTDIKWESDADDVVDAQTGAITQPVSGSKAVANLTATVSKAGLSADKFYYTAEINPLSVVLDESFEFPRSVNGQPMSARPLTGGMVPWHGWKPVIAEGNTAWDTSGTLVEENESNKAFRLERMSDISSNSTLYTWEKLLNEPVSAEERASVSFRAKRESGLPVIRIGFSEDWITDVRVNNPGRLYNSVSWPEVYFAGKAAANIGEWYNFDFLVDFPNRKCYVYCDEVFLAEGAIPDEVTSFDTILMTPVRAGAGSSNSKMLIDDIVVNKLSETELNEKMNAYTSAALCETLIKDVSLSRGTVNSVAIKNRTQIDASSRIIVAEYSRENGKLQTVKIYDIPEKSDIKTMQTVDVKQAASSGNKVTVSVWNNSSIKPLALKNSAIIP